MMMTISTETETKYVLLLGRCTRFTKSRSDTASLHIGGKRLETCIFVHYRTILLAHIQ